MNIYCVILACIVFCMTYSESARILGVFPSPAYSHYILGHTLMKELSLRGHDVTVISPFVQNPPIKNFRDIELTGFVEKYEESRKQFFERLAGLNVFVAEVFMNVMFINGTEEILKRENVQEFLNSNEQFDAVIVEDFQIHAINGFCFRFNAPCILLSSIGLSRLNAAQVGNPFTPSYIPDHGLHYGKYMNFFQRLHNTFAYAFFELFKHIYVIPQHNRILQKYFPGAPHMNKYYYNISLVFVNSHISTHDAVPHVPNLIEIGGMHIRPPQKLPHALKDYLDNSKEGVIYFSMGSNLRSMDMPSQKREILLRTFSRLKQNVLWKWEDEKLPEKPKNVKVSKWLPQTDVLAHPNVKLFLTHGGLLSTMESVYHGVPILGIPIFGDQKMNLAITVNNGLGLSVPYLELNEEKLFSAIEAILGNNTYEINAKKRSTIMHDQPMKPLDRAVFWVEYVIRHKGAPHLRSIAIHLNWYQYLLLDVIAFVLIVTTVFVSFAYLLIVNLFSDKKPAPPIKYKKRN